MADESQDQDLGGPSGSVEGKLLIRSNGLWQSIYLKYRFLSVSCNLKFLNNKLFNLQYIGDISMYPITRAVLILLTL